MPNFATSGQVFTNKINDGAVTEPKLASGLLARYAQGLTFVESDLTTSKIQPYTTGTSSVTKAFNYYRCLTQASAGTISAVYLDESGNTEFKYSKLPMFFSCVRYNESAAGNYSAFWGFSNADAIFTNTTKIAGLCLTYTAGTPVWTIISDDGVTRSHSSALTYAHANYDRIEVRYYSTKIEVYANGVLLGTKTTNIPDITGTSFYAYTGLTTNDNSARSIYVYAPRVQSLG